MERDKGDFLPLKSEHLPIGMFEIVSYREAKEVDGTMYASEMKILFVGEDSLGDKLFGLGVIQKNLAEGKNIGLITNPDDNIIYPEIDE